MPLFGSSSKDDKKKKDEEKKQGSDQGEQQEEPDSQESDGEDKREAGNMKNGDYQIHIFIQGLKQLKLGKDSTVDPIVEATVLGKSKATECKDDIPCNSNTTVWYREHLYFEFRNQYSSDIQNAIISLKIKNKGIMRDELIGLYDIDITKVYFKDRHTIEHQWLAMVNPESNQFNEVTGNLKVSICVTGDGDKKVLLEMPSKPEDPNAEVLMPAQIQRTYKQLKLRFIYCDNMPKLDWATVLSEAKMDVYIEAEYCGRKIKTKTVTTKGKNMECYLMQEMWLPLQVPLTSDRIVLRVMDEDNVQDEIAGSMFFKLSELIKLGEDEKNENRGTYTWQNLYGAPLDRKGKYSELMNHNPEFASTWKGRILMHIECDDAEQPEMVVKPLEAEIREECEKLGYFQEYTYDIIAEVGQGMCLPHKDSFKVQIRLGDMVLTTEDPCEDDKEGYNRWSERLGQPKKGLTEGGFKSKYYDVNQIEKVLVYLMDGKTPICYYRASIKDFLDPNPKFQWLIMKNDRAIGSVKESYKAGVIQFKLSIRQRQPNEQQPYDFWQQPSWSKKPPRRLNCYKVRAFIYQCRDIPSADSNGSSDCYISVWNQDALKKQTKVVNDTLNPIYYETIEFMVDMDEKSFEAAPPIVFNFWDKDGMLESDDYLGTSMIKLTDASINQFTWGDFTQEERKNCNSIPKPTWQDIHFGFDQKTPSCGQVLCSFVIALDDHVFIPKEINLRDTVETKEYKINLNILGLRQLASFGLMPVRKPFIKFRIRSMLPSEQGQGLSNIQTDPNYPGANPNINTVLTFSCQLPVEELFCPSLSCEVYDQIFMGLSQPLLGTFTIPIGKIRIENEKRRAEELAKTNELYQHLDQLKRDLNDQKVEAKPVSCMPKLSKAAQKLMKDKNINLGQQLLSGASAREYPGEAGASAKHNNDQLLLSPKQQSSQGRGKGSQTNAYVQQVDEEDPKQDMAAQMCFAAVKNPTADVADLSDGDYLGATIQKSKKEMEERKTNALPTKQTKSKFATTTVVKDDDYRSACKTIAAEEADFVKKKRQKIEEKRELDMQKLQKDRTNPDKAFSCPMVVMPKYIQDEQLHFYFEGKAPPRSIYRPVGYNSPDIINELAKLDLSEKEKKEIATASGNTHRSQNDQNAGGGSSAAFSCSDIQVSIRNQDATSRNRLAELQKKKKQNDHKKCAISQKHYRYFIQEELEKNKDIFPKSVFTNIDIMRGQSRGVRKMPFAFLDPAVLDECGQLTSLKSVGQFKGIISVSNEQEIKEFTRDKFRTTKKIWTLIDQIHQIYFQKPLKFDAEKIYADRKQMEKFIGTCKSMRIDTGLVTEVMKAQEFDKEITEQLRRTTKCMVRLYMLEAYDLASRDIGSKSDPYLIVKVGKQVYNERKKYQLDTNAPKFEIMYEFTATFPGAPYVEIFVNDYDDLFGDDEIGHTSIDLDDRFFQVNWQALHDKPIEQRELYHKSCKQSQGSVLCWVDINPIEGKCESNKDEKTWNLSREPKSTWEVRVSVMGCTNIPTMDIEGTSDVFIKAFIDEKLVKQTDTHYRCMNGKPSFNYRMIFEVDLPRTEQTLTLQAYDRDLFKSNDFICQWTFNLEDLLTVAKMTRGLAEFTQEFHKKRQELHYKGVDISWKDDRTFILYTTDPENDKKYGIELDIRIFSQKMAGEKPVGTARNEPNFEPYLPAPTGRISFTWNPIKMLSQLVGAQFTTEVLLGLLLILGVIMLIWLLPQFLSSLLASSIAQGMFGGSKN